MRDLDEVYESTCGICESYDTPTCRWDPDEGNDHWVECPFVKYYLAQREESVQDRYKAIDNCIANGICPECGAGLHELSIAPGYRCIVCKSIFPMEEEE